MSEATRVQRLAARAVAGLEHRWTRFGLSMLIILSLVPMPLGPVARWGFFLVFAAEFGARLLSLASRAHPASMPGNELAAAPLPGWRGQFSAVALLAVDFVALLSFVPWSAVLQQARWMRLFRLARMVLLIGYWTPVVNDLRAVLSRQERARQLGLLGLLVVFLSFAGTVVLSTLSPDNPEVVDGHRADDAVGFGRHLWWAFRTIEDPGNLLVSPEGVTVALVSLGLTVCGLFLVSFLIGLGTDIVRELMHVSQTRPPGMHGHTVVVGLSPATDRLLRELMTHYHKSRLRPLFAVVGDHQERPDFLEAPELARVVYRHGERGEPGLLDKVDVAQARRLVVLADAAETNVDAQTIGRVLAAREATADALIVAEVFDHSNATAVRVAGGPHTIIMPSEKLLGFFLAAVVREPGIEVLLGELLTSEGQEFYSYVFGAERLGSPPLEGNLPPLAALIERGLSFDTQTTIVPVAYMTAPDGDAGESNPTLVINPPLHAAAPPNTVGFMALAPSFKHLRRFARSLPVAIADAPAPHPLPSLARSGRLQRTTNFLVCGFRPAALSLIESLLLGCPGGHVRLLVSSETRACRVREAIAEHDTHVRLGVLEGNGPQGEFLRRDDGDLCYAPRGTKHRLGRLSISVGDWTADRVLVALPEDGAHVGEMDVVYVMGGSNAASDGRVAMAVLKLAELQASDPGRFTEDMSVIATVADPHLRRHLETRYRAWVGPHRSVHVFSSQDLRALFNFQSAAVPGFEALYSELLGPHGQSLVRLAVGSDEGSPSDVQLSFGQLAGSLALRERLLVAVELAGDPRLHIAPQTGDPGHQITLSRLAAVWVIERDLPASS